MGTRLDLLIPGMEGERGEQIASMIQQETLRLENLLSRYSKDSFLSKLNKQAGGQPVEVPAELFTVLQKCFRWNELTKGYFDISLGVLHDTWKEDNTMNEIRAKAMTDQTGMQHIHLDSSKNTVFFSSQSVQLDLGAVGKGIVLEHIRRILQRESIQNALVNFGDSSILAHGNHPYGETWAIGIQHPGKAEQMEYVFYLKDQALSTSGISARNSLRTEIVMSHILDPHEGMPLKKRGMISVLSSDPVEAEVLSTALLCANETEREDILKNFKPVQYREVYYQ